jgi:hypothetical protein
MNKNTIYIVLAVIVVIGGYLYLDKTMGEKEEMQEEEMSTTTEVMATTSTSTGSVVSPTTSETNSTVVPGYPASWPTDVPKYPNGKVKYVGGNNAQSGPVEATVVLSTSDSVKTAIGFYLTQLKANGWAITENGGGTSNMTTFRATKARRSVGGYAVKETDGKTTITVGVNTGL